MATCKACWLVKHSPLPEIPSLSSLAHWTKVQAPLVSTPWLKLLETLLKLHRILLAWWVNRWPSLMVVLSLLKEIRNSSLKLWEQQAASRLDLQSLSMNTTLMKMEPCSTLDPLAKKDSGRILIWLDRYKPSVHQWVQAQLTTSSVELQPIAEHRMSHSHISVLTSVKEDSSYPHATPSETETPQLTLSWIGI